jgi:hypothetical protein
MKPMNEFAWNFLSVPFLHRTQEHTSPEHLREIATEAKHSRLLTNLGEQPLHQLLSCVRSAPPDFLLSSPAKKVKFEIGGGGE